MDVPVRVSFPDRAESRLPTLSGKETLTGIPVNQMLTEHYYRTTLILQKITEKGRKFMVIFENF